MQINQRSWLTLLQRHQEDFLLLFLFLYLVLVEVHASGLFAPVQNPHASGLFAVPLHALLIAPKVAEVKAEVEMTMILHAKGLIAAKIHRPDLPKILPESQRLLAPEKPPMNHPKPHLLNRTQALRPQTLLRLLRPVQK